MNLIKIKNKNLWINKDQIDAIALATIDGKERIGIIAVHKGANYLLKEVDSEKAAHKWVKDFQSGKVHCDVAYRVNAKKAE